MIEKENHDIVCKIYIMGSEREEDWPIGQIQRRGQLKDKLQKV